MSAEHKDFFIHQTRSRKPRHIDHMLTFPGLRKVDGAPRKDVTSQTIPDDPYSGFDSVLIKGIGSVYPENHNALTTHLLKEAKLAIGDVERITALERKYNLDRKNGYRRNFYPLVLLHKILVTTNFSQIYARLSNPEKQLRPHLFEYLWKQLKRPRHS